MLLQMETYCYPQLGFGSYLVHSLETKLHLNGPKFQEDGETLFSSVQQYTCTFVSQ